MYHFSWTNSISTTDKHTEEWKKEKKMGYYLSISLNVSYQIFYRLYAMHLSNHASPFRIARNIAQLTSSTSTIDTLKKIEESRLELQFLISLC